jgi:hypothetical protein
MNMRRIPGKALRGLLNGAWIWQGTETALRRHISGMRACRWKSTEIGFDIQFYNLPSLPKCFYESVSPES